MQSGNTYSMTSNKILAAILFDWIQRVVRDLDAKKIYPAPWNTAQTLAFAAGLLGRLEGESYGPVDEPPDW